MMNRNKIKGWSSLLISTLVLLWPLLAPAIEFDEIRDFGDVFRISATAPDRQVIEVSWQIADGFYLYNNKFLKFKTESAGVVLGEAQIPPGKTEFDDLLGEEVIKFHERLDVRLPLESVSPGVDMVSLKIRSQGCMEDVFCYPPTEQVARGPGFQLRSHRLFAGNRPGAFNVPARLLPVPGQARFQGDRRRCNRNRRG